MSFPNTINGISIQKIVKECLPNKTRGIRHTFDFSSSKAKLVRIIHPAKPATKKRDRLLPYSLTEIFTPSENHKAKT